MDAIQFFLIHHNRLYLDSSGILNRTRQINDDHMRLCQHNLNSISWILWHLARCEDVAINRIIANQHEVLDTENFIKRLKVTRRDIGTSMTYQEVVELSNHIDLDSLRNYNTAVATKTQKIIQNLIPEELNLIPDPEHLNKILFEEGALNKNSEWVADHYSNKTKGWFLGHLGLTHPRGHLGQIILLRKLLGLGSVE